MRRLSNEIIQILNAKTYLFVASFILSLLFLSADLANAGQIQSLSGFRTWASGEDWDTGNTPVSLDTITIPLGSTVTVAGIVDLRLTNTSTVINVQGTLVIIGLLLLDENNDPDIINVAASGLITGLGGISFGTSFIPLNGFTGTTIPGPITIEDGSIGVLPIELLSFEASLSGTSIHVSWATSSELNNDFFTIERSSDGANWDIIGEVLGAGDSKERLDYDFFDDNPIPGISYYRLKQTDFDGQFEYFDPSAVLYDATDIFKVYPNPTADYVSITTSSNLEDAPILLTNLNGSSIVVNVNKSAHQASLDLTGLASGIYIIEIGLPGSLLSKRIVKN